MTNQPYRPPNREPASAEAWRARNQQPPPQIQQPTPAPYFAGVPPVGQPAVLPALPTNYMPNMIAGLLACVGIVVGSLGPWATFLNFSKAGIDGDGMLTMILGVIAAIALFSILSRGGKAKFGDRWVAPALGAITLVIAIVDAANLSNQETTVLRSTIGPSIGWGLWVVLLCGAALCVTSFTVARAMAKRS